MKKINTFKIIIISMLSAIAMVLMFIDFPVFFAPSFMKFDISDLPIMIGGFLYGPIYGIIIAILKILLKIVFKPTSTMFVGEISNLIGSIFYVVPASIIYKQLKNKKNAIVGLIVGIISTSIACTLSNILFIFPTYMKLYELSKESIIKMCQMINPYIDSMTKVMLLSVLPFNLFKYIIVSFITWLLYKNISNIIKKYEG